MAKLKSGNTNLKNAKANKNDEFYTPLKCIENELRNYKAHFKNKVVFCNCDDPTWSSFWKYFTIYFDNLELKKLISTHYAPNGGAYKLELTKVNGELVQSKTNLLGDGDFRSEECIQILKEADIVVTNPPFSLFREYIELLLVNEKKFLVIGNNNAITYKEVFKEIKNGNMWCGYGVNITVEFEIPLTYKTWSRIDESTGKKYGKVPSITWFTNLNHKKRSTNLSTLFTYNPSNYPEYENYKAINVDSVNRIPNDYYGEIGVPITYMKDYCPTQFQIVALGIVGSIQFTNNRQMEVLRKGEPTGKFTRNAKGTLYLKYRKGVDKKPPAFKDVESGEIYASRYARIIIRRK